MPRIVVHLLIAAGVGLVVWVVKTATCMMAVRIQAGTKPLPVEADELLWRSTLAGGALTLITPLEILALDDVFVSGFNSALFWIALVLVVPLGGLFLTWIYALDDYLSGLGLYALYTVVPVSAMIICRLASWPVRKWLLSI